MRNNLTFVTALMLASATFATPIKFTVTGIANDSAFGYIKGNSYSFSFVFNENYTGGSRDRFTATENFWDPTASDSALFSSISGDGISGNFTPVYPSGSYAEYKIDLENSPSDAEFSVTISTGKAGEYIGLSANGSPIVSIEFGIHDPSSTIFNILDVSATTFLDPTTYWSQYVGTYDMSQYDELFLGQSPDLWDVPDQGIWFTPTSLSILPAAIIVDADVEIYQSIELIFPTETTSSYQIQASSNLVDWVDYETPLLGDGATNSYHFSTRGDSKQYYRVKETTPSAIP